MKNQNKKISVFFSLRRNYLIIAVICLFLAVIPFTGIFAKYIETLTAEDEITAALFVVKGDYSEKIESEDDEIPFIEVSGGGTYGIVMQITNHDNDKISSVNLTYSYTAKLYDKDTNILKDEWSGESAEPLLKDTKSSAMIRLELPTTAKKGDKVEFTLITSPYSITMKTIFVLTDSQLPDYTIEDMGAYTLLTVHSNNYQGYVTVNYNNTIFVPDSTNELMNSWKTEDGKGSFAVTSFTEYQLIFFEEKNVDIEKTTGDGNEIILSSSN